MGTAISQLTAKRSYVWSSREESDSTTLSQGSSSSHLRVISVGVFYIEMSLCFSFCLLKKNNFVYFVLFFSQLRK